MTKIKLLLLLSLTTWLLSIRHPFLLFSFLLIVLILTLFTVQFRKLGDRLKPLLAIVVLIIFFQLLFNQSLSPVERIQAGLFSSTKILTISLLVFYFTSIISLGSIVEALSFLPESFRLALTITFSFIPAVIEEGKQISLVQSSRGLRSSLLHPLAGITPIIVPLIHRVLNRAEKITLTLYTKGYGR